MFKISSQLAVPRGNLRKCAGNKHFLENEKQEILEKTVTLIYSLEKNEVQCKEDAEYKSSLENSYQD